VEKDLAFWVVPATEPDGPDWLIDRYEGTYRVGRIA
jgi:hypothetical protein